MTQPATDTLKILIVEDHELTRFGLSMALAQQERIEIVGEAENGKEGVALAQAHHPDIVLMDIGMPVMNGVEATRLIKEALPDTRVVMLTSIHNHEEVMAALAAGADAYCMKEIKIDRLFQVLEMVMEGALWLDPAIARMVMQNLPIGAGTLIDSPVSAAPEGDGAQPASRVRYNTELTSRELEVLKLIVDGKSNKEIALLLGVSDHTAKAHVANIIHKLAVDDRTQVAVKALREGLV